MPEVSLNVELEKAGDKWGITSLEMNGVGGNSGMPLAGDMPPKE